MGDISQNLCLVTASMGINFTLESKPIKPEQLFATIGLLPAIAKRADKIATLCFGYGIGISFEEEDDATLGIKVIFDNVTPSSIRLLCLVEVISDIVVHSSSKSTVAVDELLYD